MRLGRLVDPNYHAISYAGFLYDVLLSERCGHVSNIKRLCLSIFEHKKTWALLLQNPRYLYFRSA